MKGRRVDVVVRCLNEMPYTERTLGALLALPWASVLVMDSGSTDGSLELAISTGVRVLKVAPGTYVPGRVINQAMQETTSDIVAFVNADAVPLTPDSIQQLVHACRQGAAASFGRQVPRPTASLETRLDYARAFPVRHEGNGFRHFFSMAASAIRRDVWEIVRFDEDLRFSEDTDWTYRVRALGRQIQYVPGAAFEHSHDYSWQALWRRMQGEGGADSVIYRTADPGLLSGFILPTGAQVLRDLRAGVLSPKQTCRRVLAQAARWKGRAAAVSMQNFANSDAATANNSVRPYTIGADPEAEQVVGRVIQTASRLLAEAFACEGIALLLVGGYGAGDGAVEVRNGFVAIHNDLDMVVVTRTESQARSARKRCPEVARQCSLQAGAPVDVWAVAQHELRRPRGKLLWADASLRGARVLWGDPATASPLRCLTARSVHRSEIGRLLVNRATGLALSRLAFDSGAPESARAARHIAKAWMAVGDGLLLFVDRYRGPAKDRLACLQDLSRVGAPLVVEIVEGYRWALAYRQSPHLHAVNQHELDVACARLWPCVSWLEAHRLGGAAAADAHGYAMASSPRFPELNDGTVGGAYLAGTRAALRGVLPWRRILWHPREALARLSVLLAFCVDLPAARLQAASLLPRRSAASDELFDALEAIRDLGA